MGLNTAIVIMNDFLRDIRNDPEFGRKLCDAIAIGKGTIINSKGSIRAAEVIGMVSSYTEITVAVGHNIGRIVSDTPEYYTLREVGEILSSHPMTIRREIIRGKLKATKVGQQWRINRQDLNEYLQPENR